MTKIDTSEYLTADEAAAAIGATTKRALYRALARARADGEEPTVELFGKTLFKRSEIENLKQYYFPWGSERRHELAVHYGSLGGTQKQKNAQARARAAKRDGG